MASFMELKTALREPIKQLSDLQQYLSSITDLIHSHGSSSTSSSFGKNIAAIHTLLLESVLPTWSAVIEQDDSVKRSVRECFAPSLSISDEHSDAYSQDRKDRNEQNSKYLATAYSSYQTLSLVLSSTATSPQLYPLLISLIATLVDRYAIRDMWRYSRPSTSSSDFSSNYVWEQSMKLLVALPSRVVNAYGRAKEAGVQGLNIDEVDRLSGQLYFDKLVRDMEQLFVETSQNYTEQDISSLSFALTKCLRAGLLNPPTPSSSLDPRPSFFTPIYPSLLRHLSSSFDSDAGLESINVEGDRNAAVLRYNVGFWPSLLSELQASDIGNLGWSFLLHLSRGIRPSATPNREIKQAAEYLERFLGPPMEPLSKGKGKQREGSASIPAQRTSENWDAVLDMLLLRGKGRESGGEEAVETRCRIIVCWAAKGGDIAIKDLIERVMETWCDPKSVKYSLFAWQLYISQLLLLALSRLPPYHPYLQQLSFQPSFLASMQAYLSHSDSAMRRLGMLVAEVLSELTIPDDDAGAQRKKDRMKGKKKDADVEELEKMLQNLGDDHEEQARKIQEDAPPSKQRRRLQFGKEIWDGFGQGKEECRRLRDLIGLRDENTKTEDKPAKIQGPGGENDWELLGWGTTDSVQSAPLPSVQDQPMAQQPRGRSSSPGRHKPRPKEPDSDDESLSGYSSSGNSSRSPSPTPSYLDEVANDPMANTSMREKIQRPVYIIQLIELLRAREEPDKLEVGLKWGESLIRRKRHFGHELEENSIFLCQVLCALSDPYDLTEFEERRQSMLVALTACVPKRVAPYLIEQYFVGQYSLMQRSAILTALSMAARETAGFSALPRPNTPMKIDFPSKVLPMALHDRYVSEQDIRGTANAGLLLQAGKVDAVDSVLNKKRDSASGKAVQIRQRQLRPGTLASKAGHAAGGLNAISENVTTPVTPFKDVAAEYFILPMINRFWTYLQDDIARESRTSSYGRRGVGTGTGMILSPMAMSHFLSALTIMLHAARHSPAFLAVLAPETLELAIAMSTHLASSVDSTMFDSERQEPRSGELEADVVAASLELALVCLDASKELDGGKSLVRDHLPSVMAAAEWAGGVFESEQKGQSASLHKGGQKEDRLQRTSASVLLTVTAIVEAIRT